MPARRRRRPGGQPPTPGPESDLSTRAGRRRAEADAAQEFAARRQAQQDEERARARAHREAAEREDHRRQLGQAKDRAADRLKEVRRRGGGAQARATAEAEYRAALDAVLRDEQGLPPLTDDDARDASPATEAPSEGEASSEVEASSEGETPSGIADPESGAPSGDDVSAG